jgi:starch synthase (maltosyl-transferring)
LTGLLGEIQPRLVQTFLFHANVMGSIAAWRAGVGPVVAGVRVAEPSWWRPRAEAMCRPLIARWVCVSRRVADFVESAIGVGPEKIEVIPNGIELRAWAPSPLSPGMLGLAPDRRVLLFVGRLEPQKGLDWLLELLPDLFARLPQHDLVVVGTGPQKAELTAQAQRLGIAAQVHWLGWRSDLAAIWPAADVVVIPSRYEGMSNVLLEAMAGMRAVVATDVEGTAEVLGPLAGGQVVPAGDARAFAAAIERFLADEDLRMSTGVANYRRVAAEFSLERMIAAYAALYERMAQPP